ncbi:hypothetical protein COCNU_03G011110 [Cocos nucifera]|uniref:Aminotransferase class I/classII large domain-containing protein n=1 Tax=Cocos nucifera TaxID=13894 RepID=A0A8K0MYM7_COCNU|nr:hypothetical protein COCNU_03G011110 [Cocos nucifera]
MDNGYGRGARGRQWRFGPNDVLADSATVSLREVLNRVMANIQQDGPRPIIPLGNGDPSEFPCFRTTPVAEDAIVSAEDAIVSAVRSAKYSCYAPTVGVLPARCAIAEYLSLDLPYKLSPDDIFLTGGCTQAIEVIISVLARPGANILLPRPGYPFYESRCAFSGLEVRHFNLVLERSWEVDLDSVEALADENTVVMVVINPGNPGGNVFTNQHLAKGAIPRILEFTKDDFFNKIIDVLRQTADMCYEKIKEIKCITCPHKPEGSMFVMVKLNLSRLEDINDDVDLCHKLAKEESVIITPGSALGMQNWLRITFAVDPSSLEDGLDRLKSFCQRHAKQNK